MKRKSRIRKITYGLTGVILGIMMCSTMAFAYLQWKASVENTFAAETSEVPSINETFDGDVKRNVSVTVGDTGYSVYVRALVVANWVNASGEIHADAPTATDYSISYNLKSGGWFRGDDGFYYYAPPVESGDTTDILITECRRTAEPPESGYKLHVEILAQTIQSAGETDDASSIPAVTDAWKMDVVNGNLVK